MTKLYYLVQKGTNIRAVTRDNTTILVEEDVLAEQQLKYERIMNCPLVAMTPEEYYDRFMRPIWDLKARIHSDRSSQGHAAAEAQGAAP
jgi:hypothetical protein